jgi:MYXO-CTERM domain-containing protein
MTKLHTTILAGLLAAAAMPGTADAQQSTEYGRAVATRIRAASLTQDQARTRTYEDGIARLRETDEEFTQEMTAVALLKGSPRGIIVNMQTGPINEGTAMEQSPNDVRANSRMQLAVAPIELVADANGTIRVQKVAGLYDQFLTANRGNEYRNANKPEIVAIDSIGAFLVTYNYQPNNSDDTERWAVIVDQDGNRLTDQVSIMAKNNDDCDMSMTGGQALSGGKHFDGIEGGRRIARIAYWAGCNGNGRDDGWLNHITVDCGPEGASLAGCTVTRNFDISLAQREERSRGRCSVGGADRSFAVCTWTEGNNQPQREGVWIAAVDLSANGEQGPDAESRLLWKDRLIHRQSLTVNGEEREYYAMRARHTRVLGLDPVTGDVDATNEIIFTANGNRGNNRDYEKGGRNDIMNIAIIATTRDNYTMTMPITNIQRMILGTDGTHLSMTEAIFGKGNTVQTGFTFLQGDQTGGLANEADVRTLGWDRATNTIVNYGQHAAGTSYDRHLYSNYLGNNPGNQGRNFASATLIKNPLVGVNGSRATYLQLISSTGKDPNDPAQAPASVKGSVFVSVFPVAFTADTQDVGGGYNDNLPGGDGGTDPTDPDPMPDPSGTSIGGCSSSSPSGGALFALFLGLAFVIRRRK